MKRRNKNIAGVLALFFGWLGLHRYYLGQNEWGLAYSAGAGFIMWSARIPLFGLLMKFFWVPFILLVSIIDAVTYFAMDQRLFDEKFNGMPRQSHQEKKAARENSRKKTWEPKRKRTEYQPITKRKKAAVRNNPFKKSGIEKFKDYDYAGAIADFHKSVDIAPNDIASHFNLACAYSLTENAEAAFKHLEEAVRLGFKDEEKIKTHHALAYLRIQPTFESFQENGYKIKREAPAKTVPADDLLQTQPDLLDQIKKLGELRNKGLLTELEFEQQKKKLLG